MGSSSATQQDDSFEVRPVPRAWLWAAGLTGVVLIIGLASWRPARDDVGTGATERPLFAGWIKYGMADFGQPGGAKRAQGQPEWALASNDLTREDKPLASFQQPAQQDAPGDLHDAHLPPQADPIKLEVHP